MESYADMQNVTDSKKEEEFKVKLNTTPEKKLVTTVLILYLNEINSRVLSMSLFADIGTYPRTPNSIRILKFKSLFYFDSVRK